MKAMNGMRTWTWRLLVSLCLVCAASNALATDAITEIILLGAKKGKGGPLKNSYREQGWTVVDKDLNDNAGGWDVYIAYKTSSDANPETGYITDICVSTSKENTKTLEGRTYYLAPTNSGYNGDLNRDAGGADIWVYFTRDHQNHTAYGGTQRVITQLSTTKDPEDGYSTTSAVSWRWTDKFSGLADVNEDAGGDDIYIQQHFATQTLTVREAPKAAENIVFDGTPQFLVANHPSGNFGTMKYRVGSASAWSTNLPRATHVGTYTVEYYLDGGIYAKNSETGSIKATINPPVFSASSLDAVFNQSEKSVSLFWSVGSIPGGYNDFKWVLYRGNTKIATLTPSVRSFSDKDFKNEKIETYTLYYVSNTWDINTKNEDAAISKAVDCTRRVPVNNFTATSYTNYIELTWTSDGFPEGFGNKFNIYVDNETSPAYTIVPTDHQVSFTWQHRTTAEHTDRQNKVDPETGVPYTEEPLNGCQPHDYRIEGVIGTTKLNEASVSKKAIGQGTLFYSFEAEKGVYPGIVKLNWHVNQQQPTLTSKTYIIDRRIAERADDRWTTIHRMNSAEEYVSYTDETPLPGVYYDYRVTVQDKCDNGTVFHNEITDIGFAHTTGTVSGRVTYGTTGTAVSGADVVAVKTGESADGSNDQYYSIHFSDSTGAVLWEYPSETYSAELLSGDFSIQMWMYPEKSSNRAFIFFADNIFLGMAQGGGLKFYGGDRTGANSYDFDNLTINPEAYSFLTLTRTGSTLTAYVVTVDQNGSVVLNKATKTLTTELVPIANAFLSVFNINTNEFLRLGYFQGYIDEFRLWKKCLTEQEILENFDHLLVGNERSLETYWTFDENLKNLFFDSSREGTLYHQHHGRIGNNAEKATLTPSALALKAKTDQDGNYIIRGIPFSGEGETYSIVPAFGVHRFNPTQQLRYIGNNSLVHNGVDFDDVSSFIVRGVAYYENTTIPVQEAYIYIDGAVASKDGKAVQTNDYGEFEVSVPIGDHFISIQKQNHTFLNDGRYPADPDGVGVRHTFDQEISGLTFYDQTKVTVAGRVVGGDIEHEKPLGLGVSIANIGQAKLRIELSNENGFLNAVTPDENSTTVSYDINPAPRHFDSSAGSVYVPGNENYIVVETDPNTGEWIAELLPLKYDVTDVTFPFRPESAAITKNDFSLPVIDATKAAAIYRDSVQDENGEWRIFECVATVKMEYKAPSQMEVVENSDGSYGMRSYLAKDINGNEHEIPLYRCDENGNVELDANGKVQYTFGYPVYEELGSYSYQIYAYERYTNYDGSDPVSFDVPLAGKGVTIKNQYASTTAVSTKTDSTELGERFETMNEKLTLDEDGKAIYQFQVGFPNIVSPFTRSMSVSYDNNGTELSWRNEPFEVIVLGAIPTGNNFITKGPDQILMVLRDPPGSNSKTTWTKGTSVIDSETSNYEWNTEDGIQTVWRMGATLSTGIGGPGMIVISCVESLADLGVGVNYVERHLNSNTDVLTLTASRDISTSDAPEFVGAPGDVFVGVSKNLLFGLAYGVNIVMKNGVPVLLRDTSITMGEEFSTLFSFDQYYIRGTMIPNFIMLRNNLLQQVQNPDAVERPASGEDPIYVTTLSPDDPRYGTSNDDQSVWGDQAVDISSMKNGRYVGPSYTMIVPQDGGNSENGYQDMVNFYNAQVKTWEDKLADNERVKLEAIADRSNKLIQNYSISAGTTITESTSSNKSHVHTHEHMHGLNFYVYLETGYGTQGFGFGIKAQTYHQFQWNDINTDTNDTIEAFSYTLADSDYADYLTVDALKASTGTPVFCSRGGATSCPYEDQDTTNYYEPGSILSYKTMQIEKPEIEVLNPIVTGVPAGESATLKLNIRNNCEVGYKVTYDIKVTPGSNPDGLSVLMDDVSLNRGSSVFVKPDETMVKTITVRQTNPEVLSYENITLRLASQCQNDPQYPRGEIADYATFSVYFQPTCSDIKLESSHTLVNTDTETPMTLSMSGYNYSMTTLKGVRLQYKAENDADFRTIQEYVKDQSRIDADPSLELLVPLEGTAKLNYVLDLRSADYADKAYIFRAVTVCDQGGKEVLNESEEIRVVRDMSRPALIATPSPSSGVLSFGDDILITFNEDIQGTILTKPNNFDVTGILNESEVAHDVALNLAGDAVTKTDATIDLSGRSFAFSLWLNYSTDGTLLTHGTAEHPFRLAIEDGYLAVTVAGEKTLSTLALPAGKWIYLHVSYNGETHVLNAGYAQDDFSKILIDNKTTEAYDGHGAITMGGNGLTAQVQELVLWNGTRSMAEAQSTMYTTKTRYTHGLLGYWPFNEGHGTVATDIARSRHMNLPSQNAWWINGANYALTLDGTQPAIVNIGALNTTVNEDYLIETWFKAETTQDGAASLLATDKMAVRLNASGYLEMVLDESPVELLRRDLRDGQWHHLALNVLKSTDGSAVCYVDGEPCSQIAASAMPVLSGAQLTLGQGLKGAIDDIRIWKARRTADVIKQNRYLRMASDEAGLVAYYPMEKWLRDEYNQIVTTPTFDDILSSNTLSGPDALSALNTPALQPAPKKENVQFNFVASERQIKINIDEQPAKIEGCNIAITAKRVKDIHGNEAQPITWSVYVQQNKLRWNPSQVAVTKTGVQQATFTADIENYSSQSEVWSISGLPTWLRVNAESGTLMPLASLSLTFTVDESLPIGTYAATVYLTGSQNIATPLNITVSSEGETPDWSVTPGESTMTVVGVLRIDGIQSSDTRDIIAAFNGNECVGMAYPQYMSRFDSYLVLLTIYGQQTAALNYKIYDASTGTIYPSVSASNEKAYTFAGDKNIGSFTSPVIFTPLNEIEQDLSHDRASWKWFSLYAQPKVNEVSAVFKDATAAISVVTNGEQSLMSWMGDLQSFSYDKMYKLEAKEPYEQRFVGTPTDPTQIDITLKPGWTWIGYPAQATNSLDAAFAGAEPQNGDMVKNQSKFALYTEGEWLGTLNTLQPGDGYMYNSNVSTDKVFHFPKPVVVGRNAAPRKVAGEETETMLFKDNMTMVAVVMNGATVVEDAQVSVFANGEWRGSSTQALRDGIHFLTVGGEAGNKEPLTFIVTLENGHTAAIPSDLFFEADAHYGTMLQPVIIRLDSPTALDNTGAETTQPQKMLYRGVLYIIRNGEMYDATGKKL